MATVVLLGTLDTKATEYAFLKDRIAEANCDVVVINAGVLGDPDYPTDYSRADVAAAAGVGLDDLVNAGDRGAAVEAMARGAAVIVQDLYRQGRLDGILGLGGSGGSSLISYSMRLLPIGVPKLLVSTMASGETRPYVGTADIAMMYSVVDIAGINEISARILGNAAAGIAGMAKAHEAYVPADTGKPLVGATMFGVTTPSVTVAREWLEDHGYEVLVFHATGTGGQSMEALMESGYITASLDITTTELVDELVGGVLSAGPDRLEMAGRLGIPQVVSLGALDMGNFGPINTVPDEYKDRNLYVHNPTVTLMRTTPEECARLGRTIAAKLNQAKGPLTVFIPLKGVSAIATEGGVFYDPEADEALITELEAHLDPSVEVIEMDTDVNDPEFATAMAQRLDEHYRAWAASRPQA
ncbi:MAG: UPF0261 family protein [Actinobacteria bacterium]|nr:UPF0261 family protein [Actinomycetota bacterium]